MKSASTRLEAAAPVVLFALSSQDKNRFLPDQELESSLTGICKWVDVSGLSLEQWRALLFDINPEILVTAWDTPRVPEEFASRADLKLRYVCHLAGGVRSILPRLLLERGILVSNWGPTVTHAVAEHAMLLTLAALRNLPLWGEMMDLPGDRISRLRTRTLRGSRVGLHGFGGIARQIVSLLKPFEVEIFAYSLGVPKHLFIEHGVHPSDSLESLFARSDVLIECEALTERTKGSVTGKILAMLPPDAVFVSVGRGAVVDEVSLAALAKEGRIRVALDVFAREPLSAESPFFQISNAVLSPHIAGPTWNAFSQCGAFALANLQRYLRGETVEAVVTLEIYDRST